MPENIAITDTSYTVSKEIVEAVMTMDVLAKKLQF